MQIIPGTVVDYKVAVTEKSNKDFTEKVKKYMREGFVPLGGATVSFDNSNTPWFIQTLIKLG